MRFGVLGPLEAVDGGQQVPLAGRRTRLLVALFLVHANEVVSADRISDVLWPDRDPRDARNAVNTQLSRLRQLLGALRDRGTVRLDAHPPGYRLSLGEHELDALTFEGLAQRAADAAVAGDPSTTVVLADQALGLWRGGALVEFADEPFALARVTQLEERRLRTVERAIDARITLGQHAEAIADLERFVDQHPLRETLWGSLMLALYRAGRQSEALATYGRVRRILAEELGISPSGELAALERAVLDHEPSLDWHPPEGATTPAVPASTGAGAGTSTSAGGMVAGAPTPASPPPPLLPLPAPVQLACRTPIAGRDALLEELATVRDTTVRDGRVVVLIGGEPGIGKTRLAAELARRVHDEQGGLVLWGRCDEDLALGYQPVAEALRHLLTLPPAEIVAGWVGVHGHALSRLVPEVAATVGLAAGGYVADPELERQLLFDAVAATITTAAASAPVMLVVDDAHWASRPTLQLLRHLMAQAALAPLLVVCTYREGEARDDDAFAGFLAATHRDPAIRRLHLAGLDTEAIARLVAEAGLATAIGADGHDLAHRLSADTGGNPFFLSELIRDLIEPDILSGPPDASTDAAAARMRAVPTSVLDTVEHRLRRLPAAVREAVAVGAIAGLEFDGRLVAAALDRPASDVGFALDYAASTRFVTPAPEPPGRFQFTHAIVRDAVELGMPPAQRAALHAAVAEALERAGSGDPARLVHHLIHAAAIEEVPRVADAALDAARMAVDQLAFEEALVHLQRALQVLPTGHRADGARAALLAEVALVHEMVGDIATTKQAAEEAAAAARAAGDPGRLADAALVRARWPWARRRDDVAVALALLDEALAALDPSELRRRAQLLAVRALYRRTYHARGGEGRAMAREATAVARRAGDPTALAQVLATRSYVLESTPLVGERQEVLAELEGLLPAVPSGRERGEAEAAVLRARLLIPLQLGDPGFHDEMAAVAAHEFSGRVWLLRSLQHIWRGTTALMQGRLDDAAAAREALLADAHGEINLIPTQAGQQATPSGPGRRSTSRRAAFVLTQIGQHAILLREHGRNDELTTLFADRGLTEDDPLARRTHLLLAYLDLRRQDEARSLFDEVAACDFADLPDDSMRPLVLAHLAEACARLGDARRSEPLRTLLEPYGGQLMVVSWGGSCQGAADRYLGLLAAAGGRWDEAAELIGRAVTLEERAGAPALAHRSRVTFAELLLNRKESSAQAVARQLLEIPIDPVRAPALAARRDRLLARLTTP